MKMKVDLSKFKLKSKDDKIATLVHPDGHEFRVAISALHPENRKNFDALQKHVEEQPSLEKSANVDPESTKEQDSKPAYADGGDVAPAKYAEEEAAIRQDAGEDQAIPSAIPSQPSPASQQDPQLAELSNKLTNIQQAPQQQQPTPMDAQSPEAGTAQQPQVPEAGALEGYGSSAKGIQAEAQAATAKAASDAAIFKAQQLEQQKTVAEFQAHHKALNDERAAAIDDFKNQHIDYNRYLGNMDTGSKIATGISLFLGGLGGMGGGNQAMDFLNKQIDRDIETQKAQLGQKHSLYSMLREQGEDDQAATNMTRVLMQDQTSNQLQQSAAKAAGPLAQARAQQMIGQLQTNSAGLIQQQAMRKTLTSGGGTGQADPASYVPFVVPKEHQAKAFGEIEAAQNTKRMGSEIMRNFDQATEENTALKTGAGLLRTPASVYALHQALQPTFKDLEGTVRQAAMDNTFKNITPAPGDSQHTIDTKKQALQEYLQSKASAPTAKAYGIDLAKFGSTAPPQAPAETKTMNGAQYQKVAGGWRKVQ